MSRSLGRVTCHYCHSDIVLEEGFRSLRADEAYERFRDMMRNELFANAHCPACEAQYLAWGGVAGVLYDLSYRSNVNDEPSEDGDYPKWFIRKTVIRQRVAPNDYRTDGWMPALDQRATILAVDGSAIPELDDDRQAWIDDAALKCRCCPQCGNPPCDGCLAGGVCDDMSCYCEEEAESDNDDELDDESGDSL